MIFIRVAQEVMYRCITISDREEQKGRPIRDLAITLLERPELADKVRRLDLKLDENRKTIGWGKDDSDALQFVQDRLGDRPHLRDAIITGEERIWAGVLLSYVPNLEILSVSSGQYAARTLTPFWLGSFHRFMHVLSEAGASKHVGSKGILFHKLRRLTLGGTSFHSDWFKMANLDELVLRDSTSPVANQDASLTGGLRSLNYCCSSDALFRNQTELYLLQNFITTCRQLKALRIESCATTTIAPANSLPEPSWMTLTRSFAPLAATLESLDMTLVGKSEEELLAWVERTRPIGSLKHFHCLRRLAAPEEAFKGNDRVAPPRLQDILPCNLESITIYYPTTAIRPRVHELHHTKEQFPKLEQIKLQVNSFRGGDFNALSRSYEYVHMRKLDLAFQLSIIPIKEEDKENERVKGEVEKSLR